MVLYPVVKPLFQVILFFSKHRWCYYSSLLFFTSSFKKSSTIMSIYNITPLVFDAEDLTRLYIVTMTFLRVSII